MPVFQSSKLEREAEMILLGELIVAGALHRRYRASRSQGEMTNRATSRNLSRGSVFRDERSTVSGSALSVPVFYLSRICDAEGGRVRRIV